MDERDENPDAASQGVTSATNPVSSALCPQCGANQNGEGCACAETVVDPRFAALAGIREQLAKKNEQ